MKLGQLAQVPVLTMPLPLLGGVPKGNLVHSSGLMGHDGRFEAHVSQKIEGAGLDAVGATSRSRLGSVVYVFDLVSPSRQDR